SIVDDGQMPERSQSEGFSSRTGTDWLGELPLRLVLCRVLWRRCDLGGGFHPPLASRGIGGTACPLPRSWELYYKARHVNAENQGESYILAIRSGHRHPALRRAEGADRQMAPQTARSAAALGSYPPVDPPRTGGTEGEAAMSVRKRTW